MKTLRFGALGLSLFLLAPVLHAQVPQHLNYQGRIVVGTTNFDGSGSFKFALVNDDGTTTYWSNDGTSTAGSQPAAAVTLTVTKGLYSVQLGDTSLTNMTALPTDLFSNSDVRLRIWFNDGSTGSQLLKPDQRITAVGYAMMARALQPGTELDANSLHVGSNLADATSKLIKFGDGNFVSIGEDTLDDQMELAARTFVFRSSLGEAYGKVGIGTTAPSTKLDVDGTVTATAFSGDGSGLTNLPTSTSIESPETVFPAQGMVWIKPGKFLMGRRGEFPIGIVNEAQHWVTLTKGFWMSVHEVTEAEYAAVGGGTGDTNLPVNGVDWEEAMAYCTTLTTTERNAGRIPDDWEYRLPTEAEWEYCCRAGARNTRFGYGDDLGGTALGDYAWTSSNSGGTTHPVEQKRPNSWGLMDMHGNVWEWCQDWLASYPPGSATDPQGPQTGEFRVVRGGSIGEPGSFSFRCANRDGLLPEDTFALIVGFRVVLAPVRP